MPPAARPQELNITALQYRAFDLAIGLSYMEAIFRADKKQEEFLRGRFRPELKKAMDAWLATDPLNNPAAPRGPFIMAEYVQQELIDAKRAERYGRAGNKRPPSRPTRYPTPMSCSPSCSLPCCFSAGSAALFNRVGYAVWSSSSLWRLFAVTLVTLGTLPICNE